MRVVSTSAFRSHDEASGAPSHCPLGPISPAHDHPQHLRPDTSYEWLLHREERVRLGPIRCSRGRDRDGDRRPVYALRVGSADARPYINLLEIGFWKGISNEQQTCTPVSRSSSAYVVCPSI